ncbi:ABZJ_00895 family protein [Roseovarius salis]|uniref:ABZJ_00895 family protein n=1 Tax=Roseovarius salis TaxID=3376063 RepID=UPI0037C70070
MRPVACIRYALVFLGVAIGASVLVSLLNATVDSALGSSAQLMVPAMIAAVIEGQQFAKREKRKPKGAAAWNFTWVATIIAIGLNLLLAYAGGRLVPEFAKLAIAPAGSRQFLILLALYAGGYLVCNRLFLGIGAGNQLSLMRSRGGME